MDFRYSLYTRAGAFCLAAMAVFLFFCGPAWSADLHLAEANVCLSVEDRKPMGAADEFSESVGKLFCYTLIEAASPPAQIIHRWYYQDNLVHEYPLPVHASRWRTWSNKNIFTGMAGPWRVDVFDPSRQSVIGSVSFRIH